MNGERVQRRLAAVLAVDVAGYSRLMGENEEGTLAALRALRREVGDPKIAEYRGRIVKTTGDGLLVEFASVVDAVRCAVEVQREMQARNRNVSEERRIEFRMGINVGDIIIEDGDIFGDGVNVAARLEALAEPGGIVVSGVVHQNVRGRVDCAFEDMDDRTLKNISRPVRTYRVLPESGQPKPVAEQTLALPDKPSIAVLPFQNMSGDPEQEYFADGMVEEITTALSRVRAFFVIARNSSFAYKGKSPDVRQVGRELGVRYVLEGSVRKSGERVRITGQLIDATTGAHVWADRFDGGLQDIFDLQDQVTASVVGAIEPKLRRAEIERAQRKPTENLQAYDLFLRAADYARLVRQSARDTEAAVELLRQAVKLDAGFAMAYALMAEYLWGAAAQLRREPPDPMAIEAVRTARLALALDSDDPEVLWRVAHAIASPGGRLDEALAMVERSLELNPNSAGALLAHARLLSYRGETEAAISQLQRATRLSPVDVRPWRTEFDYTMTHFVAGRYDLALEWSEKALRSMPGHLAALRYKIASLGLLGRIEEGQLAVREILAVTPELTVKRARAHIEIGMNNVYKTPGFADAMCRGLRLAGLPE